MEFINLRFQAFEIFPSSQDRPGGSAFLTGYYEPVVDGAMNRTEEFSTPMLARPDDLVMLDPGSDHGAQLSGLSAARRRDDGSLEPYPDRWAIDAGAIASRTKPVAWVRDAIEAFMIQVQGSAAIRLNDGAILRLSYSGKNGRPYTSIGKILVDNGFIPSSEMSLERLKRWVRDNGQAPGDKGLELLQKNASYVFFSADTSDPRTSGPIGGSGVPLSSLRSIAIDTKIWPYGLPFWIDAELPWTGEGSATTRFRRLLIGQDTGGAIVGPARADIYFGSGDKAGLLAGGIHHYGRMIVFLPKSGSREIAP